MSRRSAGPCAKTRNSGWRRWKSNAPTHGSAGRARLPNPELELGINDDFIGNGEDERSFEIAFTQRFPLAAALRKETDLRAAEIGLAEVEFANRQHALAREVDGAWIELAEARERAAMQEKMVALQREVLEFLDSRAEAGEVSPLDAARVRLAVRTTEQSLAVSARAIASAEARLRALLGMSPQAPLQIQSSLALPGDRPAEKLALDPVLRKRPDYIATRHTEGIGMRQLALASARRWEDIGVSLRYERESSVDAPEGRGENDFVGIGVSIPLPIRDRKRGGKSRMPGSTSGRRNCRREARAFAIRSELARALAARVEAYDLARSASGDLLDLAHENHKALKKAQADGQAGFLEVQRAQEQLLDLQAAAVELAAGYHRADAEVRFASADYPVLLPSPSGPQPANNPTGK